MEDNNKESKNKTGLPNDLEERIIGPINNRQFILLIVGGLAIFIAQKLLPLKPMLVLTAIVIIIIIKLWNKSANRPV